MNEKEFEVVDRMAKEGGSFVKALAECFYRADRRNIDRLKETFKDYWEEYSKPEECDHEWSQGRCINCGEKWQPEDFSGATPGDR